MLPGIVDGNAVEQGKKNILLKLLLRMLGTHEVVGFATSVIPPHEAGHNPMINNLSV
jgi:hypothetical protein